MCIREEPVRQGFDVPSLTPLEEARAFVLAHCRPIGARNLAPRLAVGHVLSAGVVSPESLPPFTNSAMDGYALRAEDTVGAPVRLRVMGALMAGDAPWSGTLGRGQALRIMTGAPIPQGADAVCMVELTHLEGEDRVVIERPVASGANVRELGDDVRAGTELVASGTEITPAHVGLLTAAGVASVQVFRRPRVGVLSTGDELFEGLGPLPPGRIRDSNRPTLLTLVDQAGFDAIDLGTVGDDAEALALTLEGAADRCEALVTSGGVSVGDRDAMKAVLEKLSDGTMRWMQVAIKPAKPFAFGVLRRSGVPVFALPGNPVSAMVSFELFARPALRQMAGHAILDRPLVRGITRGPIVRRRDGKLHFVRVSVRVGAEGLFYVTPTGAQGAHQLKTLVGANALAIVPDGEGLNEGAPVEIMLLGVSGLATEHRSSIGDGHRLSAPTGSDDAHNHGAPSPG